MAYRANREAVFKEVDEKALIKQIADAKDYACQHMDELYAQFKAEAEKRGVHVHRAATAAEANDMIVRIAKENKVKKVVKSKSMTAEEIGLNTALEGNGLIVDETDLGEWIIQLRHEGPSHMVMPAIHLSRYQVADDFTKATGVKQDSDVQRLVKVARVQLRRKFIAADMGVSGCNFAVAENGAISTVTNEGNARMVLLVAFFLRKGFPRLSAVVKAPVADKVHAPKQVIKVKGGAGGVGVVLLPFKPVHFHVAAGSATAQIFGAAAGSSAECSPGVSSRPAARASAGTALAASSSRVWVSGVWVGTAKPGSETCCFITPIIPCRQCEKGASSRGGLQKVARCAPPVAPPA